MDTMNLTAAFGRGRISGMRINILLCVMAALAMLAALPAAAQQAITQEAKDASITARVKSLMMVNPHLSAFAIDTNTKDGVVTLTGGVDDDTQKSLAADIAKTVPGVTQVVNRIIVVPDARSEKDMRNFRQRMRDKGITTAVRGRLVAKGEIKGLKIGVDTVNDEVTLSGIVRSDVQSATIQRIAEETAGVAKVYNHLTVIPPGPMPNPIRGLGEGLSDETIEKRVEKAILVNKHLNAREIDVEVNRGVVILTGSVDTEEQRQLAQEIALSLAGVNEVRNELRLYDNVTIFYPDNAAPMAPAPEQQPTVELVDIDPYEEEQVTVEAQPLPAK